MNPDQIIGGFAVGRKSSPPINHNNSSPTKSQKGGGSFAGFSVPRTNNTNGNSLIGEEKDDFKPAESFRNSLAEVAKGKLPSRIFNQAAPGAMPSAEYLSNKRGSVFHKAFESGGQVVKDFVPPVYPKSATSTNQLVKLFTDSFLTKDIDPKNHLILA